MTNGKYLVVGIVVINLSLFVGCNANPKPQPSTTPLSIVATRTPLHWTNLATPRPRATRPANTVEPTLTPLYLNEPTPDFRSLESFHVAEDRDFISPDGKWIVHTIVARDPQRSEDYTYLAVERTDGSEQFIIEENWSLDYFGPVWPEPYRWSNDGNSLYYIHNLIPDGCDTAWKNAWDLYRADLLSKTTEQLLPFAQGKSLALSPDETLLAYYGDDGLFLRDLKKHTDRHFDLPINFGVAGNIVWSPDQSSALIVWGGYCTPDLPEHAIMRVDWALNRIVTLIEPTTDAYLIVSWEEMNRALIKDRLNRFFWIDPITGELTPRE